MNMAYVLEPDEPSWTYMSSNNIDVYRDLQLPGIHCSKCDAWATTGLIYPSARVSARAKTIRAAVGSTLRPAEFQDLVIQLRREISGDYQWEPGAEFGRASGRAKRATTDLIWVTPWLILVDESSARRLEGIAGLTMVATDIRTPGKHGTKLLELEAHPVARLAIASSICIECGRPNVEPPEEPRLSRACWIGNVPLQRPANFPTMLIANEALAQRIADFKGAVVRPIQFA